MIQDIWQQAVDAGWNQLVFPTHRLIGGPHHGAAGTPSVVDRMICMLGRPVVLADGTAAATVDVYEPVGPYEAVYVRSQGAM